MKKKRDYRVIYAISAIIILLIILFGLSYFFDKNLFFSPQDYQIGNISEEIQSSYGPGANISGWINISLKNVEVNSTLEANGIKIPILTLIQQQDKYSYVCSPLDCKSDYLAQNPNSFRELNLEAGSSILFGSKIDGEVSKINSFSMSIDSNAPPSCFNQIKVDILNDNSDEKGNPKKHVSICEFLKRKGCFRDDVANRELLLTTTPYCQRINLSESPAFQLGAWLKRTSSSEKDIFIGLRKKINGEEIEGATCRIRGVNNTGSEYSCEINFSTSKQEEYYVCIYTTSGEGEYYTRGYLGQNNSCGFQGNPPKTEVAAYDLYVMGMSYDAASNMSITNDLPNRATVSDLIQRYLETKYGRGNCSKGCIIPIKIRSELNQRVNLSNLRISFDDKYLGAGNIERNIYEISESPAVINSNFDKLYLDNAGFNLSKNFGNYTFELKLNGRKILTKQIFVERVPEIQAIIPSATSALSMETFIASVSSFSNITRYIWEFGDGERRESDSNTITHMYNSSNVYSLRLTVVDLAGRNSSKVFEINVGSSRETINKTIQEDLKNIEKLKAQIESMNIFEKRAISEVLNLSKQELEIQRIQQEYKTAISETSYNTLARELLSLNIPSSVNESYSTNSIEFINKAEDINLDIIANISNSEYKKDKGTFYRDSIIFWSKNNISAKYSLKEFSGLYSGSYEHLLTLFSVNIDKNNEETVYLVIKKIGDMTLPSDALETEDYYYFELEDSENIQFSTTEKIKIQDLEMFLSPSLGNIKLASTSKIEEAGRISSFWLFLLILLIFGCALVAYIILQEWYKKSYEKYLFQDMTNLYNIINYIIVSKKKSLSDKEIKQKLVSVGWTSEQVEYAVKKYNGERTGMFEIKLPSFIDTLFSNTDSKIFRMAKNPTTNTRAPTQNFNKYFQNKY